MLIPIEYKFYVSRDFTCFIWYLKNASHIVAPQNIYFQTWMNKCCCDNQSHLVYEEIDGLEDLTTMRHVNLLVDVF